MIPGLPWGEYLETACWRLTAAAREGEPIIDLSACSIEPARVVMPRMLYGGNPTELHADGDTGKSLFALALLASVQSGAALPGGLRPELIGQTMYLDYETDKATHSARLQAISAGLGIDLPAIAYKRMRRPLVEEAATLAAEIARRNVVAVVVDSMIFALTAGDGAFHEPITAFYNALNLFAPAATLVLNHVTNSDARAGGPARPFGGAFATNGPRLIWSATREKEVMDATAIAFTNTKANNHPRRFAPFGLRFTPGESAITIYPFDLREASPSTVKGVSIGWRIRVALASGAMTAAELAEHLDEDIDSVRRALQREKKKPTVVLLPGDRWGLPTNA